jgi:hypothetical protein
MRHLSVLSSTCLGLALWCGSAQAADPVAGGPPSKAEVEALIDQAQTWLLSKQQADGAFVPGNQFVIGITGLAAESLSRQPKAIPATDARLAKSFALLKASQQPDGGIYNKDEGLGTYGTSITLMAFAAAGKLDEDKAFVKKAQDYLFGSQIKDGKNAGGIGYDQDDGPEAQDMPNTSFAVQALRQSGVPSSDAHLQSALKFLEKCQNLSSVNKAEWVNNDGGSVYSPNESKANGSFEGEADKANPQKKLVSTGSMTYSLLSSYLALDLKSDDPRVAAALAYAKSNYRFDANPGMVAGKEHQGLYYYYTFMAKTMDTLKVKELELAEGKKADWRADLFKAIKESAKIVPVGEAKGAMWMNDANRWGEGMPHLATCYMLKALKAIDASL